jgi:hypothetical protein
MSPDHLEALSRSLADPTSRRGLLRLVGVGVAGTAVTAVGLNEALAKNNKKHRARKAKNRKVRSQNQAAGIGPVASLVGIPVNTRDRGRNFKGNLDITEFKLDEAGTGIVAVGHLTGKVTGRPSDEGKGRRNVDETVELPVSLPQLEESGVAAQQTTCTVLHLVLGPITLNLLGLNIFIGGPNNTPLIIDITADPTGGLLGQLLSGLLCGGLGLPLDLLVILGLLNQILDAILQGL